MLISSYRYKLGNKTFKLINKGLGRGFKENEFHLSINEKLNTLFEVKAEQFDKKIDLSSLDLTETKTGYNLPNKSLPNAIVVAWDIGHNPVGRAFLFAEFLSKKYQTTLVGPIFSKYGKQIWEPIKNRNLKIKTFKGSNFPDFYSRAQDFTKDIDADLIIICKPRIPSLLLGNLIKARNSHAKIVLDIDDYELSFFNEKKPLPIGSIESIIDDIYIPYNSTWTRISESLVKTADHITVSNKELQKKFGGEILPHVRNEDIFKKSLYPRKEIRKIFGYNESDKVILFIGTPRFHKGIIELANAIEKLNQPDIKLCVIGNIDDQRVKRKLSNLPTNTFQNFRNIPFEKLPACLSISDLICLYQDAKSPIAQHQMPAKVSDAISMEIPLITSNAKPLLHLEKEGVLTCVDSEEELAETIKSTLNKSYKYSVKRKYFLETHSYKFGEQLFEKILISSSQKKFEFPFDKLDKKFQKKQSGLDIVFFWKQNDSDIYGRRQDMILKHLSKSKKIKKIIHFDAPISTEKIQSLKSNEKGSQNEKIIKRTQQRIDLELDSCNQYKRVYNYSNDIDTKKYLTYIKDELKRIDINVSESIFWFCPIIPFQKEILENFKPAKVINDVIDDQTQYLTSQKEINQMIVSYEDNLRHSDISFCNTLEVKNKFKNFNLQLIPNGAESFTEEELKQWERPMDLPQSGKPILGYVGNLDPKRLDLELIKKLAIEFHASELVFIGSTHMGGSILQLASEFSNISLLGVREYQDALKYIKHFDVALIPHLINDMTRFMNPLKMYNYASLGRNIVATNLSGMEIEYSGLNIASNHSEFIELLKICIDSENKVNTLPGDYTWESKTEEIISLIEKINPKT